MQPYVAAFRAYEWNETIEFLADRFFSHCRSARKVVLADETRGTLPVPSRMEKLSHTEDTSALGLRDVPRGSSLWHNVDYGPIILRHALPGHDHYLLSESDLAVNLDLEPMMAAAARDGIDFIARDIRRAEPDWFWYRNGRASFDEPWRSLLFFMVFSGRAIDAIARGRRELASRMPEVPNEDWPFCESFVPSLLSADGMRFAALEDFADTAGLNYRPRMSISNPDTLRPGSLTHSVLSGRKFIRAVIAEQGPRSFFDQAASTAADLRWEDERTLREELGLAFLARRDHAGHARLMRTQADIPEPSAMPSIQDLSTHKPAVTSSTSPYSHDPDPTRDACGANGTAVPEDYGFHTDEEAGAWWMVDLLDESLVEMVQITNRRNYPGRFRSFAIESSRDGNAWTTRFSKFDASDVSSDPDAPFTIGFADPFLCRFLRIKALERGVLHLRHVRVSGVVVYPRARVNAGD